jgi:peroxiredoxin
MAETLSTMLPLGTRAPDFTLPDVCTNKALSLTELRSDIATVIMFICNHCPYVIHIQHKLASIAKDYQQKGVAFIAINSNDAAAYPADSPEKMKLTAETNHYTFPYLYDETQKIAHAYQAACTPDFYVFDSTLSCVYRGRFDDSTPGNHKLATGRDLTTALDCLLAGETIPTNQKTSIGCNIKWKRTP